MSNDVGHRIFSRLAFSQALDEEILLISSIGNFLAKISNPGKQTYVRILNEHAFSPSSA
jgi:hypothetical protein